MKKFTILYVLLLFLSIGQQVNAQNQQNLLYVGIPRESFDFYAATQEKSEWCWAASLQMIFNYYGVDITQDQIVERTYGDDRSGNPPDWSGTLDVITENLNNWNVDNNGRKYVVSATVNYGAPTPLYLVQELKAQHPVLIGYRSGPNSSHAVVITACSYIQTYNGPYIQSIVVRDPWPSYQNVQNKGRIEYRAIDLANVIEANWFITIQ